MYWPWAYGWKHPIGSIPAATPLLNFNPLWPARKPYACAICYSSDHVVYECPLPNMRIGGIAIMSAMSVALVSNKKAQEQIIEVDQSLKPVPPRNPAAAPAAPPAPAAPAPARPLTTIPEESPWSAPALLAPHALDITAFISWMAEHVSPHIPQLDDATILAAAERNTGGLTAMCTDLLRDGYPIRWTAVEILSHWGQWVRGEIPYGPGAGSQADTNASETPFGKPQKGTHMAMPWLTHARPGAPKPPGNPPSDEVSMISLPSEMLRQLNTAPETAQRQYRDWLAQLVAMFPSSEEQALDDILKNVDSDLERAISVMYSPHSPYHRKPALPAPTECPLAPDFVHPTDPWLAGVPLAHADAPLQLSPRA